jgi:serine/threonine protein kinase
MPISLEQFVAQLTDSGLIAAEELEALRKTVNAPDAEQLARALVHLKKLTPFQAQQVYSGKAKSLVLGNYVLLDKLGQGGMGMVLKAEHRRMKRVVALKVLSPKVIKTPELLQRFQREVQAAARLTHPHIVAAFDADEAAGTHYLVMEFVDGRDLSSVVKQCGPMPWDQAVHCVLQAAKGLDFAHRHGVIHRDIKPANLLLDAQGTVKVLDMGLARIEGDTGLHAELTSTGAVMGTVDYMAPEQAVSTRGADARSDVYSLGITLWYLLTARPAYDGESLMARMLAHRDAPLPSLVQTRLALDPSSKDDARWTALEAILHRMIAKQPTDRYQTMSEVIAALEGLLRGDTTVPAAPASTPSADSQFSAFLANLSEADAAQPRAGHRTAAVTEFAATVDLTRPEMTTDPTLMTSPAARRTHRRVAGGWRNDRRVQVGAVAVLGLMGLAWMMSSRGPQPTTVDPTPVPTSPRAATAVAAPIKGAGLEFDGVDDYVHIPTLRDLNRPLTYEAWIEPGLLAGSNIVGIYGADWHTSLWGASTHVGVTWATDSQSVAMRSDSGLPSHQRVHVAGVVDGESVSFFFNGQRTGTLRTNDRGEPGAPTDGTYFAGGIPGNAYWRGRMFAVRVSRGVRYVNDFTPQPRWANDADTLALYEFDAGSGTVLTDASGHSHDGQIVGAEWVPASPDHAPPTASDAELRVLLDPLRKGGGRIHVRVDGQPQVVDDTVGLPVQSFVVERLELDNAFGLTVEDLERLAVVPGPYQISFPSQLPEQDVARAAARLPGAKMILLASIHAFTAATGRGLGTHSVEYLVVSGRDVAPGSLAALKPLPGLKLLLLQKCVFQRSTLAEINQLPHLTDLNLEASTVGDADLDVLTNPTLKRLALYGTQITWEGVAEFRRRRPEIELHGLNFLPAPPDK